MSSPPDNRTTIPIRLTREQWEAILLDMEFAAVEGDISTEDSRQSHERMEWIRSALT